MIIILKKCYDTITGKYYYIEIASINNYELTHEQLRSMLYSFKEYTIVTDCLEAGYKTSQYSYNEYDGSVEVR